MTLRVLSLLIICICIAPLAVQADAAVKVMPLGDSITRGGSWTTSPYPSYRYYLDESLRASGYSLDFVGSTSTAFTKFAFDQNHEGHGGYTTGMMVGTPSFSPLAAWLASSPAPDIVLLHVGTNDALEGIPLATRIANMKKIVSILRQKNPGVRVLMAQIIPTGDAGLNSKGLLLDFNRALPSIAAGLSTPTSPVAVVDLFTGYDGVADNQPDGIHPKTSGERKMAGAWHRALAPVLSRMSPGPGTTVPTVRPTVTRTTQAVPSLSVRKVPGVLEAEDYDPGGAGVSYRDTTPGNSGGAYRQDDVDIEVQGGTTNLAFVRDGEWLQYTVAVSSVGRYRADFRVSSWGSSSHSIAISVNGKDAATVSVPTTGGPGAWTTASTTLPLPSGTAVLRFRFSGDGQNLDRVTFSAVAGSATVKPTTTAPTVTRTTQAVPSLSVRKVPGVLEAEDYDPGGAGVSYRDTTPGNSGGAYRQDDVDIEVQGGTTNLAFVRDGEWLQYTVAVSSVGRYRADFRVSSWGSSSHSIAISVNGKDAATVSVPTTGGPGAWTTASTTLPLPSGTAVLRFRFSGDGQNLDRVTFSAVAGSATVKPTTTAPTVTRTTQAVPSQTGSAVPLPGTIQSEDYNPGGEGVSYHDTTPGNQAGAYRGDGVDIVYAPAIRSYVVTQIRSGEWLEYTVTIPEERYYQLAFRLASQSGGQFFDMKVDGRSEVMVMAPRTWSMETYSSISTQIRLAKGTHRVRIQFHGDGLNFDSFRFT